MSTTPVLTATKRERLGSRYAGRVRDAGGLPAIVYGHKEDPLPISLDSKDALGHIHKGEKVFQLQVEGVSEPQTVLLRDVQFDYLGTRIIHCDLARVSLTDRVTIKVPVHLVGEAKGLKIAGAILMHPTNELDVECMVTEIPAFVEVDISELDEDHAITAADVKLPSAAMKLKTDVHAMVAQIVIQLEIVEEKAEEVAVEGAVAEPEVITAKKKEGEEGEAEAKPGAKAPAGKAPEKGAEKKAEKPAKEDKKK